MSGTCPEPGGCDSCPDPARCRQLRVSINLTTEVEEKNNPFPSIRAVDSCPACGEPMVPPHERGNWCGLDTILCPNYPRGWAPMIVPPESNIHFKIEGIPLKIYVASKAENWWGARLVMETLEADGHVITFDWTRDVELLGPGGEKLRRNGPLTVDDEAKLKACAEADANGVTEAHVIVVLSYPGLVGTLIETGIAVSRNIPVFFIGTPPPTIFTYLSNVHTLPAGFKGLDQLRAWLSAQEVNVTTPDYLVTEKMKEQYRKFLGPDRSFVDYGFNIADPPVGP